jgi:transcription elongation GreA/GreB family factor
MKKPRPDKQALKAELLATLTRTLEALEQAHADAAEGATHAEAKPENDKDTRAIEASYLARGQAMRVEALRTGVAALKAMPTTELAADALVSLGALVEVEEDDATLRFFLAPEGGGSKLAHATVQVVTPSSPLGQALLGRGAGESFELTLGGRKRELSITVVA